MSAVAGAVRCVPRLRDTRFFVEQVYDSRPSSRGTPMMFSSCRLGTAQCVIVIAVALMQFGFAESVRWKTLPRTSLKRLSEPYDERGLKTDVERMSVVRVPGTSSHRKKLSSLSGWHVEEDSFIRRTPHGAREFTNVIATFRSDASVRRSRFVLGAHYDSKWFPEPNRFVGATDSAVSVVLLLDLARTLTPILQISKRLDVDFQLVFFDGEEAFEEWNNDDSLYGSRHLAKKWETSVHATQNGGFESELESIRLFLLLDLLGVPSPRFVSIERRMRAAGVFPDNSSPMFSLDTARTAIEDDHIPFVDRGVPAVVLCPLPFAQFWHTNDDNVQVIDWIGVHEILLILRIFCVEYLSLNV